MSDVKPPEFVDGTQSTNTTPRTAPTEVTKPDLPSVIDDREAVPQSYVWLANGEIRKCNDADLPVGSGDAPFGHWQEGNKVHTVVAVYPAEITLKG
jgi:hypothetical protein